MPRHQSAFSRFLSKLIPLPIGKKKEKSKTISESNAEPVLSEKNAESDIQQQPSWDVPSSIKARITNVGMQDYYELEVIDKPGVFFKCSCHTGARISDWLLEVRKDLNWGSNREQLEQYLQYIKDNIVIEFRVERKGNQYYHCSELARYLYVTHIFREGHEIHGQDFRVTPYGKST